ncbi:helix-turn-helix domain-containing protein, partial [Acidobacteriota bacterium]
MREDIVIEIKQRFRDLIPAHKFKFIIEPRIDHIEPDFTAEFYIKNTYIKVIGEVIQKESSSAFYKRVAQLKLYEKQHPEYVPLMVVRYLSYKKQEYCRENNINYLDFSGNVYLNYQNIYIEKTGFINKYPEKRRGRNPFSDKASLILRLMLEGNKVWGVRELAEKIDLNPGFVSRMFKELEELNYITRRNGKARLINKNNLLMDWVNFYDYKKNKENRFFCLSKGPEEIFSRLRKSNISKEIEYA